MTRIRAGNFGHATARHFSLTGFLLALALLLPWTAAQADNATLRAGANNHLPRIATPANAATHRINRALASADRAFAGFADTCHAADRNAFVRRKVAITARGPAMVSLVATDATDCGGAYPNTGTLALVFDLRSGRFVDWTRLLPAGATATRADEAGTDAVLGVIVWEPLRRAYLARYRATPAVAAAVGHDNIETCAGAVAGDKDFILWPDTGAHALMAQPVGLPHVAAGCEVPVALDATALKTLGLTPGAIAAITGS
ncbi:MAG TPA: hypothetical protein VF286_13755 [Acidiphilium sp.]